MHAIIWKHRIDIFGAQSLSSEMWGPLLDDLKAEHVSGTPPGKRVTVVGGPRGGTDAFVYRTDNMADEEVVSIFKRYGIPAEVGSEKAD